MGQIIIYPGVQRARTQDIDTPERIEGPSDGVKMSEAQIQRAVIKQLEARAPKGLFWFHVPNGGARPSPVEMARLKMMGLVPGVPDLILVRFGRTYALELKAEGGRVSPQQHQALQLLRDAGAMVAIAFGYNSAMKTLEDWGMFQRLLKPRDTIVLDPQEEG